MVNQSLTGYNTENGKTNQELPEKSPISGIKKRKLFIEIEKKESKTLKKILKTTRVDKPEPSVQLVQVGPEQCKKRKCIYLKVVKLKSNMKQ